MTTNNDALARAGRAAIMVDADEKDPIEDYFENVARAVLESLGIEWTGGWEWRVVANGGGFVQKWTHHWEAVAYRDHHFPTGEIQRRPKLDAKWEDVSN